MHTEPIEKRVEAYNYLLEQSKKKQLNRKDIQEISDKFQIHYGRIYDWYKYNNSPFGKRKLGNEKEVFYLIGALLGDGCAYHWKKMNKYSIMLVGEKEFIEKFSVKITLCTGRKVKGNINRSAKIWQLISYNFELYLLIKGLKMDLKKIGELPFIEKYDNSLQFIEGFFDAEGCVKIIKEKVRKTPKICLDICSTDQPILEVIRKLLQKHLGIEARYSIQEPKASWKSNNKKTVYYLRIYKKEYIRKFFEKMSTIKLKPEKKSYVEKWLNNGK